MPFYVIVRSRGSRQPSGYLGPYSRRSSALTDASALKSASTNVEVTQKRPQGLSGPRSNPVPAIAAAGARILAYPGVRTFIATVVLPKISRHVEGGIGAFRKANRAEQVAALRKLVRFVPPPHNLLLRRLLKNDKAAAAIARALSSKEGVKAMRAAARSVESAAASRL
jgi:hypothetical protein